VISSPSIFTNCTKYKKYTIHKKSNRTTADLAADTKRKREKPPKGGFSLAFRDFRQRYFQFFGLFLGVFPSIHYFFHSRRIFPAGFFVLLRN